MSKIDEINKQTTTPVESGKRTKAVAPTTTTNQTPFPTIGSEKVAGFSKSSITPKCGSEFLLDLGSRESKVYGFELNIVTHASLKFEPEYITEKISNAIPIIKEVKIVNNELIAILDKALFLKTPSKSNLLDASRLGLNSYIDYTAIPKVLYSIAVDEKLYAMGDEFIVKLNSNIIAVNFLIKDLIKCSAVTISEAALKVVKTQILKNMRINTSLTKTHLNVAIQFVNVDHLASEIYLTIEEKCFVAVNTQLTTDLFALKANNELKKIDLSSQCIFTSTSDLLRNATKGDDISKCLVKPKTAISYAPVVKLSHEYLHPAFKGSVFAPVAIENKCDDKIIKAVFKDIINENPVTVKSLDTDSLYLVPDVFKLLQYTLLKEVKEITVGGLTKSISLEPLVTSGVRININCNNLQVNAIFTI